MNSDRDTLPPDPDPTADAIARVEKKLDELTAIARTCFEKLVEHDGRLDSHDADIDFLRRLSQHPGGNGR